MIRRKNRNIEYLGFDDFWFVIIGVLILSLVTNYLFAGSIFGAPIAEVIINWSVSVFFASFNWFVIRKVMIALRKRYTAFHENAKRITLFFMAIVGSVVLVNFLGNLVLGYVMGPTFHSPGPSRVLLPVILISVMTMATYEAIYYYARLKKSIRQEEQTKQAVIEAQLEALRNQAQPHFFFNTLNTLRDIIDQNSKEEAKEFVDKLSDVYRFILESGNSNLIALREELKFAEAYVHIQKERFGDKLQVEWDIEDLFLDKMIVPMSLQLLLENAIKHNVVSRAKPLMVNVAVENEYLVVRNEIQLKSSQLPSTKLGLKNIEKRYSLISSKNIDIKNDGKQFSVNLPLLEVPNK